MNLFNLDTIKTLITQALLEQPTGDDWLDSRYNEQVHYIGHTNPYYRLFYLIAQTLKPAMSVELGSWQATAACHLAAGNPAGSVYTVDIHKDDKAAQQRAIEAAGHYENLTYLNMWTWDAIRPIASLNRKIDLLFIDAWHNYDMAMREFKLYAPLLADNALVICDDITTAHNFEGMLKFWDELPGEKFLDSRVHPGIPMGFAIVNPLPITVKYTGSEKLKYPKAENVATDRTPDKTAPTRRGRPKKSS